MQRLPKYIFILIVTILSNSSAQALCTARTSLTGLWHGNDKGKYHFASNGRDVWWMGDLNQFTNVFHGVIQGDTVSGSWADVQSANKYFGSGTLQLKIVRTSGGGIAHLKKIGGSGNGFGADTWTYPCNDTVAIPAR